jgi:hypothetical protein
LGADVRSAPESGPKSCARLAARHRERIGAVLDIVKPEFSFHGHYHIRYDDWCGRTKVIGLVMDGTSLRANALTVNVVK